MAFKINNVAVVEGNTASFASVSAPFITTVGTQARSQGFITTVVTSPTPPNGTIERFPFSATATVVEIGGLDRYRIQGAGYSSSTHGYVSGGNEGPPTPPTGSITKFSFSASEENKDVGSMNANGGVGERGISSLVEDKGYSVGGFVFPNYLNVIESFPFASDTNASDHGDLTEIKFSVATQVSSTSGYTSGGSAGGSTTNVIEKFSLASASNSSDVGDLTANTYFSSGHSSPTHGYKAGGQISFPGPTITYSNVIEKFPFSTDTNASDVGDMYTNFTDLSGGTSHSSDNHGYITKETLQRFPFATDTNASAIGSKIGGVSALGQGHEN